MARDRQSALEHLQNGTRVYLTLEKTGGDAVVTFKNTSRAALNIPAEELMERFVRGDSSRSTEGNGLGLALAQQIVELSGGTISVENLPTAGCRFTVRLPIVAKQ